MSAGEVPEATGNEGAVGASTGSVRASWTRRVLGPLHFTGVFWYRLHLFGLRVLPEPLLRMMVALFSTAFTLALFGVRRAVGRNLRRTHPDSGRMRRAALTWRVIHEFSWCLTERYEQFLPGPRAAATIENPEAWLAAAGSGKGVLLVTAHLGGWELGSTLPAMKDDVVVHVVREEELDSAAQSLVEGLLEGLGGDRYHTHFARGNPELGLELFDALRRGEVVALQGDRPRAGGESIEVSLLGVPFHVPAGVPTLARAAGVPILPVFTLRVGRRRYRVHFRDLVHVPCTADRVTDVRAGAEGYALALEWALREAPLQWFRFGEGPDA